MASRHLRMGEVHIAADPFSHRSQIEHEENEKHSAMIAQLADILGNVYDMSPEKKEKMASSIGIQRPPLANINTTGISNTLRTGPAAPTSSQFSPENRLSEIFFPGLNTPDDLIAHEEPGSSGLTVEKLRQLADLLSPLRSHSSASGSGYKCNTQEPISAGSQSRSFVSSFGHPLEHCSSHGQGYRSDPGPKNSHGDSRLRHQSVPVISYKSVSNSPQLHQLPLRTWGMGPSRSYFELYRPIVRPNYVVLYYGTQC